MDAQRGIARRMVIGLPPDGLTPAWEKDFSMYAPAGVIVFARDFRDMEALRALTTRLRALAAPRRLFIALDEEGGWVSQLGAHLVVPPNAALLARGARAGQLEQIARVTARRLRALGFDWDFAPVADVHSEPDNPVIGPRAYGTTPQQVSAAVAEIVRGFRAEHLASCLKHFPGHGDTRTDSHHTLPVSMLDRATIESRELVPFLDNLDADSVMSAHVVYRSLDPDRPGTFSPAVVGALLREHAGYRGLCVTDALEMQGAAAGRSPAEAGALALGAGCDLLLYAHWNEDIRRARLELADALVEGRIDRTSYDAARPRLAAFDAAHGAPGLDELSAPLESLTPPDWNETLTGIIDRGLIVQGTLPPAARSGAWSVDEPEFTRGATLAADLAAAGVSVGGAASAAQVIAVCSRLPQTEEAIATLRARCAERPTVLVGLQNDAFLAHVPQAAVRLSASDATPLTRARVAARLVEIRRGE